MQVDAKDFEIEWLAQFPEPVAQAVRGVLRFRDAPAGVSLHHQDHDTTEQREAMWGLLTGSVRSEFVIDDEGHLCTTILHAPMWFGAAASITSRPRMMSMQTASEARLAYLTRADFGQLSKEYPELWRVPALFMAKNIFIMMDRISALMVNDSKERLHRVLLTMCPVGGHRIAPVDLLLTQEEIAQNANLTSRSVRKFLGQLESEGLIQTAKGRVTVL